MLKFWMTAATMLLLFALWSPCAAAHMMPVWHGTLNLVEHKAYIVLALPVSALGPQVSPDGQLTPQQLQEQRVQIEATLRQGLSLKGPEPAKLEHIHLELHEAHGPLPRRTSSELSAMIIARWEQVPQEIELTMTLWPEALHEPLKLSATISRGASTLKHEQVELTPQNNTTTLFSLSPSPQEKRARWLNLHLSLLFWSRAPLIP